MVPVITGVVVAEPLTLSPEEAGELVGCSADKVRDLVHRGVLPRVPHLGRLIRIPRVALLEVFRLNDVASISVAVGALQVHDGGGFS